MSDKNSYLLKTSIERDLPIPVLKPFAQILNENFFLILVLTLSTLVIIIWRFLRKKNSKPEESNTQVVVDPYKEAIEAIDKLQGQKNINPKPFVFKLSEILRIYVERLFNLPAMELTGEEFLREISEHAFFKNRFEEVLKKFVEQGDSIKYSSDQNKGYDTKDLLDIALRFVNDTHQKLKSENLSNDKVSEGQE
jgi:hypothetical protein